MVENCQGLPAISAELRPAQTHGNAELHQGLSLVLLEFMADSLIGFNGGNNLWGYCGNNPVIYTDPTGKIFGLLIPIGIMIGQEFAATLDEMGIAMVQSAEADYVETQLQVKKLINEFRNGPQKDDPKVCKVLTDLEKLQKDLNNQGSQGEKKYRKKKSGLSGGSQKNDITSWGEGERPLVGESGKDFAKRLCDERYGRGNYPTGPGSDYNKLKKYGDSAFE